MSDNPNLDLPMLEALHDVYAARADAIGCLALRLDRIEDPTAAELVTEAIKRLVLSIPLPKAEAGVVAFGEALRVHEHKKSTK